jgi:hypothetical protein
VPEGEYAGLADDSWLVQIDDGRTLDDDPAEIEGAGEDGV